MDTKGLMAIKKDLNKKRPDFIRQGTNIRPKLKNDIKWRRAAGKHSKIREGRVSHRKAVQAGYRSPVLVRGMNLLGQVPVLIHNLGELASLNPQRHVAIISSTVGLRHKIEIAKKAKEMNLKANLKLDVLEARLAKMRQENKARQEAAKKTETKTTEKAAPAKEETLTQKLGEVKPVSNVKGTEIKKTEHVQTSAKQKASKSEKSKETVK